MLRMTGNAGITGLDAGVDAEVDPLPYLGLGAAIAIKWKHNKTCFHGDYRLGHIWQGHCMYMGW